MNIAGVSGYGDKISLQLMKKYTLKKYINMRDLYRFAKARRENKINSNYQYIIRFEYDNKIKLKYEHN
jgi:hypothetical protein